MKLLIGLGNPGDEYKFTRHNIGFMVLDQFFDQISSSAWEKKFDCFFNKISINKRKILFLKPLTFMNLSGNAVQKVKNYYKITNNNIVIIHDDIDLELGRIKLKEGGGDGGHNGLKSVAKMIGNDFFRIRVGIGRPKKIDISRYVLDNFHQSEISILEEIIFKCCNGIKLLIEDNNEKCNNIFSK